MKTHIKLLTVLAFSAFIHSCGEDKKETKDSLEPTDESEAIEEEVIEEEEEKEIMSLDLSQIEASKWRNEDGQYEFVTPEGENAFPGKAFDKIEGFIGGYAKVGKSHENDFLYTFIDSEGNQLGDFEYVKTGNFVNGMVWVQTEKKGLYGYMNSKGELVIPTVLQNNYNFNDGLMPIVNDKIKSGSWTINRNRRKNNRDLYGYINVEGDTVIAMDYRYAGNFSNGLAPVIDQNGRAYFINPQGEKVLDGEYDNADEFLGAYAPVSVDGKWGMIDRSGNFVLETKFDDAMAIEMEYNVFVEEDERDYPTLYHTPNKLFAMAQSKGRSDRDFGLANEAGEWVLQPDFFLIKAMNQKYIKVYKLISKQVGSTTKKEKRCCNQFIASSQKLM